MKNGFVEVVPEHKAAVTKALSGWKDCLIYGIGEIDSPKESAVTIAEGAMAGCIRAETNLEDRLFDGMKGQGDPREVRAMAHDMMAGFRERMRSYAIRVTLKKHQEEGGVSKE